MEKENVVYVLRCKDGSFYTGWTNDIGKRIEAHSSGKGAKYTKGRLPVSLVYTEACASKQEAMSREFEIKKLTREQKSALLGKQE